MTERYSYLLRIPFSADKESSYESIFNCIMAFYFFRANFNFLISTKWNLVVASQAK